MCGTAGGWGAEESLNASLNMPLTVRAAVVLTELSCGEKGQVQDSSLRGFGKVEVSFSRRTAAIAR